MQNPICSPEAPCFVATVQQFSAAQQLWGASLVLLPTAALAGAGYFVVHSLSIRRQRRDEFFKLIQSVHEQIDAITTDATKVWSCNSGQDAEFDALARTFVSRVARLSALLSSLHRRQPKFSLASEMVIYRQVVTGDVDSPGRNGDFARVGSIAEAGTILQRKIDTAYLEIFG